MGPNLIPNLANGILNSTTRYPSINSSLTIDSLNRNLINTSLFWNTTNDTFLDALSVSLYRAVFPFCLTLSAVCIVQLVASGLILAAIIASIDLRQNRTFILLGHISLNDALLALGDIVASSTKIYNYATGLPHISTVRKCFYSDLARLYCYTNSNGFLFLLGLSRLISVSCPIWYQSIGANRVFTGLSFFMYIRSAIHMILLTDGLSDIKVPLCGYLPRSGVGVRIVQLISVLWTTIILFIYLMAVVVTYIKLAIVRRKYGNGSVSQARQQLQVHVMWTMALVLIVHTITTVTGNSLCVYAGVNSAGDTREYHYTAMIGGMTSISLSTIFYFPVLYGRCADFKKAVKSIFPILKCVEQRVGPLMAP